MAKDERQKARANVRRAQAKLEGAQSKVEEARQARRESFEQARKAGLTLREIGEAAELHWTRVGNVLGKK
jgi:F0F1-type ATP synthase membrane subunit b/b'